MQTVEFQRVMNGLDVWACVIPMILIVVLQSVFFMKAAVKESKILGITPEARRAAIRSACITAVGPSLSPVILMLAMSTILGTPYTWFVLNNVGAARTELASATMGANFAGVEIMNDNIGIKAWTYGMWAGILNSTGWLAFVFLFNHKMEGMVNGLYSRYNPKWIKALMAGANLGLFAYLLSNNLVNKPSANWFAAVVAAACGLFFGTVLKKYQKLQEVSLGVSMLVGMFVTQAFFG